jgi:NAD(P)-dependent dehydrogenase (short-subunit alcohol dehydrogenase family)
MRPISGLRVAWTGGTRGFGLGTVRRLVEEGADVAFCGRNAEDARRVEAELSALKKGRALGAACDVRRYEDVAAFAAAVKQAFGALDVLVNSAGLGRPGRLEELPLSDMNEMIDTNLKGLIHSAKAFLPLLRASKGALMINVGSVAGKRTGPGHSVYCASKFAVAGFSQALARELQPDGIRVCHLVPGPIRNPKHNPHPALTAEEVTESVLHLLRTDPGVIPLELELISANEGF